MRTDTLVVVLGVGIAVWLCTVRFLDASADQIPPFLGLMAGAFLFYFAAVLLVRRASTRVSAAWVIGVAVLIQLAPYRGQPVLDRDAYRYHWDGLVLAHGVNPYRYAPGDHHIANLRDQYWESVDYKHIHTIYPPVTQFLVAGSYFLDQTPRRILLLAMGLNLLCLWPLLLLLRARGIDDKWLLLYAWNPLLANEFATGGHLDAIAVLPLLIALYCLQRERPLQAGAMMALGVMGKTQMLLVAPLVLRSAGIRGVGAFVVASAGLVLPFIGAGAENLVAGSVAYLRTWESNSSIFAVLQHALGSESARIVTGCAMLALVAWLAARRGDVVLHVGLVLGALLALSPTFFPWYISWVLPVVCLYPSVTGVVATFLLLGTYVHYVDRELGSAARVPEFVLLYGTALVEYLVWRRGQRTQAGGATPLSEDSP